MGPGIDFETLFARSPNAYMVLDRELRFVAANEAWRRITGAKIEDLLGRPLFDALPDDPDDPRHAPARLLRASFERVLRDGVVDTLALIPWVAPTDASQGARRAQRLWSATHTPLFDGRGQVAFILQHTVDVTDVHREHLEALVQERTRARDEGEAALRQAQKLEAVGKLTGGVAHDFNNLLQVITGNLQLLHRELEDERMRRRIQTALAAAERGARLSSQLLAFARKQPLQPTAVNVGALVADMEDLLLRAMGEDVELCREIESCVWHTFADPDQLESAILHLATNARDAMGGEGLLTIEARNVTLDRDYQERHPDVVPGEYVELAVTDTGCGMTPEVMEQAFEPFFTTRGEGRGTGLGLSMVYGFVKQTGGHVEIESEVGRGTTLRLFLPRAKHLEALVDESEAFEVEGGTETILVVEDDASVRETVVDVLSDLGYRVLEAADGQAALALLQGGVKVDLLFTDVVMPGPVRATELARTARALLPDLEVLFTSAYAENAIVHNGRLDPGVSLLSKPYRREDLARKLRHQLRNQQQRRMIREALAKRRLTPNSMQ
ncbi:MAG: response regulator [Myxococcaceae bacterium]|nr:response regulator [Myxococcaceae bacterium]